MPSYRCKIASRDGQVMERIIQSASVPALRKTLAQEGRFLIKAEKASGTVGFARGLSRPKLKPKDVYSFNHEFLTLLRAGLPAVSAFDGIIGKQKDPHFTKVLKSIRKDISSGESLPAAFEKHEELFSPLYIAILYSGEASGNIPGAVEEFLDYFERSRQIRQKIKTASVYPVILSVCSVCVLVFLLVFVVPAITGSFLDAEFELPVFTLILLRVSDMVRYNYREIFGLLFTFLTVAWFYSKTRSGRLIFDRLCLRTPFIGEMITLYSTALFSSSLSTVLGGGTPLNRAITIACRLVNNRVIKARIEKAILAIEQGEGFSRSLGKIEAFPDMALRMFAAGEEGGSLEKVLKDVAYYYEKEVEGRLSMVTSTIEPALMIIMGFVIGFILVAMYLPIFQLAATMG
ncbi:MAG: type II secretion system F family protein [Desulfobacteraceae bacterium]|nr:MAG: type II secretion system F family protein [Desulfobacteraceae bacterium]